MAKGKFDWDDFLGFKAIISYMLTIVVAVGTFVFSTVQENADLRADKKYRDKYEPVLTENIMYKLSCGSTVKPTH